MAKTSSKRDGKVDVFNTLDVSLPLENGSLFGKTHHRVDSSDKEVQRLEALGLIIVTRDAENDTPPPEPGVTVQTAPDGPQSATETPGTNQGEKN